VGFNSEGLLLSSDSENWKGSVVFIVTFIGIFVLILGNMPSNFTPPSSSLKGYNIPPNFDPRELGGIEYFLSHDVTMTFPATTVTYDFNGATPPVNFRFLVGGSTLGGKNLYFLHSYWYDWFFLDNMQIENASVYNIYYADIVGHLDEAGNKSKFTPIFCNHVSVTVWISDWNETRDEVLTAWNTDGKVAVSMGMGIDVASGGLSGWDILGRLMTFQAPEILGLTGIGATILNAAIALPLWAMIAYIALRLLIIIFKPFG